MKRFLTLFIAMMSIAFLSIAKETKGNPHNRTIGLEFHHKTNPQPTVKRTPMRIDIEAFYNAETNTIDISYDGEAEGEVYVYLGENLVAYESGITTSIQLPTDTGLYRLEIVAESWIATGYIQL